MNFFFIVTSIIVLLIIFRAKYNKMLENRFVNEISLLKIRLHIYETQNRNVNRDAVSFINLVIDNAILEAYHLTMLNLLLKYKLLQSDDEINELVDELEFSIKKDHNLAEIKNKFDKALISYVEDQHKLTLILLRFFKRVRLRLNSITKNVFYISLSKDQYRPVLIVHNHC